MVAGVRKESDQGAEQLASQAAGEQARALQEWPELPWGPQARPGAPQERRAGASPAKTRRGAAVAHWQPLEKLVAVWRQAAPGSTAAVHPQPRAGAAEARSAFLGGLRQPSQQGAAGEAAAPQQRKQQVQRERREEQRAGRQRQGVAGEAARQPALPLPEVVEPTAAAQSDVRVRQPGRARDPSQWRLRSWTWPPLRGPASPRPRGAARVRLRGCPAHVRNRRPVLIPRRRSPGAGGWNSPSRRRASWSASFCRRRRVRAAGQLSCRV